MLFEQTIPSCREQCNLWGNPPRFGIAGNVNVLDDYYSYTLVIAAVACKGESHSALKHLSPISNCKAHRL